MCGGAFFMVENTNLNYFWKVWTQVINVEWFQMCYELCGSNKMGIRISHNIAWGEGFSEKICRFLEIEGLKCGSLFIQFWAALATSDGLLKTTFCFS